MSKHPTEISINDGLVSPEELADALSKLRYDVLTKYIDFLAAKIMEDGWRDYDAGRKNLGAALISLSDDLYVARDRLEVIWKKYCNDKE